MNLPDVDIDVQNMEKALAHFPNFVNASKLNPDKKSVSLHNNGVYFQNIPKDPHTNLSSFTFDIAEQIGYCKIDFINYHVYDDIKDEEDLKNLIDIAEREDFPWELFLEKCYYDNEDDNLRLTHLKGHYGLVKKYPPKSVIDVASLLALIRPGKKHLIGKSWDEIKGEVWKKPTDGTYYFKKSHAIGYALVVIIHLLVLIRRERT